MLKGLPSSTEMCTMDLRLKSFCESVSALASKMASIYSLSLDLNLSKEITNSLLAAKSSLAQTNTLIQVLMIQESSDLETENNTNTIEKNFNWEENSIIVNNVTIKDEVDDKTLTNDLLGNKICIDDATSDTKIVDTLALEVVEAKIEIEDSEELKLLDINEETSIDIEAKIEIDEIEELSETEGDFRKESDTNLKQNLKQETKDFNLRNESEEIEEDVKLFLKENTLENGESSFICRICGKTKTNKNQIVNHVNFHKRKSNCNICDEAVRNFEMKKHKEEKHKSTKVSKQQCRHCYKSFPSEEFSVHFESCRPIKVQCDVCGKVCNGRKNHSDHMRIHMRPYIYTCQICNRKYRTEGELERHNKCSHLDIRTCHICGASIKGENTLKQHMLTHSEDRERGYSCEQCGKSFFVASSLKKHKKTHSDERPFSCDICSKSFKHEEILGNHIRKHNKDDFFKCEDCGKLFSFKSALQKHIRRIHKAVKKYSEINQ